MKKLISKNKKQQMKDSIKKRDPSIFRRKNTTNVAFMKAKRFITPEEKETLNKQLLYAAEKGDLELTRESLDGGANVDAQDKYGYTPLMLVSLNGFSSIADLLLQYGADMHIRNKFGAHASMYAALKGHEEITQLLRKYC